MSWGCRRHVLAVQRAALSFCGCPGPACLLHMWGYKSVEVSAAWRTVCPSGQPLPGELAMTAPWNQGTSILGKERDLCRT